jgi:hypothetical protein
LAPADPRRGVLEEFAHRASLIARTPGIDAAALEACDALAAAGVDALLLKGASLARMLYRPGEHRGYFDVDLLAAPGDQARAGTVLAALGYMNLTELRGVDDVAGIVHEQHWSRVVRGFGNVSIDLHWKLPGCEAPADAVWAALNRHRTTIELEGRPVPTLDRAGLALHLPLHAAQHGSGDLKAVGDLRRGLHRWPSETWGQAGQLAHEVGAVEAFAAGLRLLPAGIALADELGLPEAEAQLWAIAHREERPRGVFHLTAFNEATGVRERMGIARRTLLPKRAWIAREYPWAAVGRIRLFTAYGIHALRSPAWAARAWRFRRRAQR